jgi:hypothetical protein
MQAKKFNIFIALATILVVGFGIIAVFFKGSGTFADALRGYELLWQFTRGSSWNTLNYAYGPQTFEIFVSWWSPGQWMLPWLFLQAGLSIQATQALIITICTIGALWGYWLLFRKFGFSALISLASIALIATNQLFYWHYILYYGGDLLLLAFLPFFLLFLLKLQQNISPLNLFFFTLLCLLGIFLKSTFIILIACSLCLLFLSEMGTLKAFLKASIAAAIVIAAVYFTYLSKGETPGSATDSVGYNNVPNDAWGDIFYSFGSPLGVMSRFSPFLQKLATHLPPLKISVNLLQIIPFITSLLLLLQFMRLKRGSYAHLLLYFSMPFFAVFTLLFLMDKAVSYEMRHFAPIAFLWFPGILHWALMHKGKKIFIAILIAVSIADVAQFPLKARNFDQSHSLWNGIKIHKEEVEAYRLIEAWDKQNRNGIAIIEGEWEKVMAVSNNDKIALEKTENEWGLASGMELDNQPKIELSKDILAPYSTWLIVSFGPSEIIKELGLEGETEILKSGPYVLYFSKP